MNKDFPNRWIFVPRDKLQEGYATFRCHCICCNEEWNEILKDVFKNSLTCPFCKTLTGKKDFEIIQGDLM